MLYDYLVNPLLLAHCPPEAELICLGKHGRSRLWSQDEINARIVADALAGKVVVRLKSGDPAIFAHYAEEVEAIEQAGLRWEMVPGITAALAASSFAGVPLTHREFASSVAMITAHEDLDKTETAHNFTAYAAFPGTLVFYMGVTTVESWTQALISAGKDAATPAAIIRRCSFADQTTVTCRLDEVAERIKAAKIRPPVIVIIGPVVASAGRFSWFNRRPLAGRRILITRAAEQSDALAGPLRELGADVVLQPAIVIRPPADWGPVDATLSNLSQFDWLVFSSRNGVRSFLSRLLTSGKDLRALGKTRIAAIGPGTAEELAAYHLRADIVPQEYQAEALAAALAPQASGKRFLLVRASRGREVLAEQLAAAGGIITQVVAYESVDANPADGTFVERMRQGDFDWVTVTSSAIARSVARHFGAALQNTKIASISPLTSAALQEFGLTPHAEATTYDMHGVIAAILQAEHDR